MSSRTRRSDIKGTLVKGGDALAKEFYEQEAIVNIIANRDKCPIIMLENLPYSEPQAGATSKRQTAKTQNQTKIDNLKKALKQFYIDHINPKCYNMN